MLVSNGRIKIIVPVVSEDTSAIGTLAIVSLDAKPFFKDGDDVKAAIVRAVDAWMTTDDGEEALDASSGDFNVGDLAENLDDSINPDPSIIQGFLNKAGIFNLKVETLVGLEDHSWTWDNRLFTEASDA